MKYKSVIITVVALILVGLTVKYLVSSINSAYFRPEDTPAQDIEPSPYATLKPGAPTTVVPQ